ncbi:2-hydroxy-6-oxonona-2,4-dienedioate hydrolase [Pricia antarctica]|uniref:2-hydroxy-6-oxonona-2,4-dienedioate hydrolase n=1 Tax=Pricia antarctica TaxID=641691 RepID=A0A1G7B8V9_9FLAO|nr:alpha/beta hydrolase [Pricia antarctica]SDE23554.1 2-hydroxy-6-oxonona-2,4-dienedioate hydrolase [Pricia antarctica]
MNAITKYQNTRAKLFEEFHTTAQSKYLETIGPFGQIHYLESGQGTPLVLVHGGLGHSSEWIPILKPLSERYRLFIVDRPGLGLTSPMENQGIGFRQNSTAFIHTFMKGIGVPKAILLGSSMGGYFSICFALEYPWKVEKLLLIGAPAGVETLDSRPVAGIRY